MATGITAIDMAHCEIAWRSIGAIGVDDVLVQRCIVLDAVPAAEAMLEPRFGVRWSRLAIRPLGMRGLPIPTDPLAVDHDAPARESRLR